MKLRLLPQAEADIGEIARYIAHDSKMAAHRWAEAIHRHCDLLLTAPGMGVARDEVRPGLRMMPSGNYVILYRLTADAIEIVRVVDGRRRWKELF